MADAEGRRVFVEASLGALPQYERLGWRVMDKLTFSMEDEEVKEGRVKEEERVKEQERAKEEERRGLVGL